MPNWKKVLTSGSDGSLNSLTVTHYIVANNITASLSGTASYANNANSSSYSNNSTSSSYALSASWAPGGSSVSASYAATASYVSGSVRGWGISNLTVGTTEPVSPSIGDLWVDTN
jgi:hypothetical protein